MSHNNMNAGLLSRSTAKYISPILVSLFRFYLHGFHWLDVFINPKFVTSDDLFKQLAVARDLIW